MKTFVFAWICLAAMTAANPVAQARGGDQPAADSTGAPVPVFSPSDVQLTYRDHMLRDRFGAPTTNYLSMSLDMTSMQWYQAPTRFEATLRGAGAAATLGMFFGAVGTTLGWFDEDTSWIVTGSLAAIGAAYGNTQYRAQPALRLTIGADR